MIRVSLNNILNSTETFSQIMQQSFKGSIAFKVARLARELNKEMETFNTERQKLLERYSEKDKNGELKVLENGNVQVIPEKLQEFNQEFTNLLETDVEINADKLPMSCMDEFEVSPQQMLDLEVFFED